ncbi:putative lipoprotein LppE [Mycobacterium saskatchewanense]|uniref:Lipoprotein LppE n=1 Tax=Mycobacterium saskatchewanense TaxID=220927 RepID=A0AAJ3NQX5_9MYCO|nr:lipoprotein LpqH [Mycobacterium saskatchewanense]ORW71787.1 hypothetical protein AWC23_13615 [Mycobacterium saskatchewanense]BBX63398.1 putative lipoprotein LppE [Mycobacterium saskatchewanense]
MPHRVTVAAVSVFALIGIAACSPKPQTQLSSTASVTVDGNDANMNVVKCTQQEWYRTIDIGGDFAGAKVVIDQRTDPLVAESVRIQNLGGFTGMYSLHDGGGASMSLSGDKFTITGTANGHKSDKPAEPASATFKIVATC